MKLAQPIFSIIIIIFLLFSVAIFVAGSLIFLNIQVYDQIYQLGGLWIACLMIVLEILIFSYGAIRLIKSMFCDIFNGKKSNKKNFNENGNPINKKLLFGVLAYELLKLLYINKSRR